MLTLKNKGANYFISKMSSGIAEKLQPRINKLWQTIGLSWQHGRGACFYRGKKVTGRGSFAEFSLAGLLLGKEKFFLLLGYVK